MGFLTSIIDSAGQTSKDYDEHGRLKTETRTIGVEQYTKNYGYNAAGLLKSIEFPDGQVILRTYDAAGNLYSETGTITSADYNASSQAFFEEYDNGITTTKTFSPTRGWLESVQTEKSGRTYQDLDYDHYPDGTIQTIVSAKSMETRTYTYDDLNRLQQATNIDTPSLTQSFQYDPIGNITFNSKIGDYLTRPRKSADPMRAEAGRTELTSTMPREE